VSWRVAALAITVVAAACNNSAPDASQQPSKNAAQDLSREPLQPLPAAPSADSRVLALGEKLFTDLRFSSDGKVGCVTCHNSGHGGGDGRAKAAGAFGAIGDVNAPTVFNSGLNFVQFWDGRAASLEDQVSGPLTNPAEMGSTWEKAMAVIASDADYRTRFDAINHRAPTQEDVRSAIATFERSLLTSGSPFDRWLGGDKTALTPEQASGYETFKSVGCIACHQGRNVGGNMFQHFGVFGDYFKDRGNITKADNGRFNVTQKESDRFVFRVPSLRNAARTAPYFHDGSAATLEDAVQVMARYQLGRALTHEQLTSIVAFIGSLRGTEPVIRSD
jgi:cytochrome c peroxidase